MRSPEQAENIRSNLMTAMIVQAKVDVYLHEALMRGESLSAAALQHVASELECAAHHRKAAVEELAKF